MATVVPWVKRSIFSAPTARAAASSDSSCRRAVGTFAVRSSPQADNISGYRGPTECLVALGTDGRTITGIIKHEDDKSLLIRTTTEDISLPIDEIRHRKTSPVSMMPEGLLESMSTEDARDLIAYLASPVRVK